MYDQEKADRVVNFFRLLKHTKGKWAGVPFNLTDWQEHKILRPLFGTVNADGTRQYRTAYISVPRKNGKSEIGSGIGLYGLFADGEAGAEIYSAASDREQASIVFNTAIAMVQQSKALSKRCKIIPSQKRIIIPGTNSFWRVLSADAFTKHGLNAHMVIFDELHAQPNRELWDVLTTSGGTREQPLIVALTTAGYDRNSICYEQYDYAKRVASGEVDDPTFYSLIYEADVDDDWKDGKVWKKANPGLGDFRNLDELQQLATRAAQIPALQNTFRMLYLNQWVQQYTRWMDIDAWNASAGVVDVSELEGRECFGGLDLSSSTDLSAFVLEFPMEDGTIKTLPHFWIPGDNLRDRGNRDKAPYEVWVRDGHLTATPGNVIDYGYIKNHIIEASERFNIKEIAYDRWNSSQLVQDLIGEGLTMVPMGQGFASMSAPSKELMTRILLKRFHHGANPVLDWMINNVTMRTDPAGNIKPDKEKSTQRIDGIVAAIMALDRVVRHECEGPSVYEERGLKML